MWAWGVCCCSRHPPTTMRRQENFRDWCTLWFCRVSETTLDKLLSISPSPPHPTHYLPRRLPQAPQSAQLLPSDTSQADVYKEIRQSCRCQDVSSFPSFLWASSSRMAASLPPSPLSSGKRIFFPCPSSLEVPRASSLCELLNDLWIPFDPAPAYKSLTTKVSRKTFQKSTRKIWINRHVPYPCLEGFDLNMAFMLIQQKLTSQCDIIQLEILMRFLSFWFWKKNNCKMDLEDWVHKWTGECWKEVNWGNTCSPICEKLL